MKARTIHIKRPFNPKAPHTSVTYCGEHTGRVEFGYDAKGATCKKCLKAYR